MTQSIFPVIRARDAQALIAWLESALGAERLAVHEGEDGSVQHAEVRIAGEIVMLGGAGGELAQPPGHGTVYVALDEVDALHDRAAGTGAEVVRPPSDTDYGSRDLVLRDPEGNFWSFGTYRPAA